MSGAAHGNGQGLLVAADSPVHRLPAQCKVAAAALFVLASVSAPREELWSYAWDAALLLGACAVARVPATTLIRRLVVEVPFLLFLLALPFAVAGPRTSLLGVPVSAAGGLAALAIACKATIGLLATGLLAATTSLADIVDGVDRLHVPGVFTAVASFTVRYGEVLAGEFRRLQVARVCRGGDARWLWQARDVASCVAALLVRSFERGERVYLAMLSRGYTGMVPAGLAGTAAGPVAWGVSLALPAAAGAATAIAWAWR